MYGGAGLGTTSVYGGIWTYDIMSKTWGVGESDIDPPRLTDGGSHFPPSLQKNIEANQKNSNSVN